MERVEQIGAGRAAGLRETFALAAWIIVLTSTVGSLFFSEVMELPPCVLCWYQRIALYPLVFVIAAGIFMRDARMKFYALPLALAGLAIAVYHNLIYYNIIPESITPCSQGIPCNARQIEWFGVITIPLLSVAAFLLTSLLLLFYKPKEI